MHKMLAKTGLLIVTNPKKLGSVLSKVQNQVKSILYIQLMSALSEPFNFYPNVFTSWPKYSNAIHGIYSQAAVHCRNLDVRVLLNGLKHKNVAQIQTQHPIDLIIFDKTHNQKDIDSFLRAKVANLSKNCDTITVDVGAFEEMPSELVKNDKIYSHSVLGGTFDRLHIAHKLLLTEAILRANSKITVGVTEENMLHSKTLWELIEPIEVRLNSVTNFLRDLCFDMEMNIVPISDPFGPTKDDPTMELLVVSAETLKGGEKVNEVRLSKGLKPLDVLSVELIDEPNPLPNEEAKISSSTTRIRLLGTLLKPVEKNLNLNSVPYVIGLTGGIGSGKSGVAKHLENLGAEIINCDIVAHELYKKGKPCYTAIVGTFGDAVLDESGEINRKALGAIVFKDPQQLQKLNSLVWPAIGDEVAAIIKNSKKEVVVVEAAVLLNAGWQKYCHEVWTTIIPRDVAVDRLKSRNNLSQEQAEARINAQPHNKVYVQQAHVVFCTLWPVDFTREQVVRAWRLLKERRESLSQASST